MIKIPEKLPGGLLSVPISSISDALDQLGIRGVMSHEIKPVAGPTRILGAAVTIRDTSTDEKIAPSLAMEAIDLAPRGSVIVRSVEGTDARDWGLWGGLMTQAAKAKGIHAAILDGGVRDLKEIKQMKFRVCARSVVPSSSVGRSKVSVINVPIECGGVTVEAGDVIVGDTDGVVAIPRQRVTEVLSMAEKIDKAEKREMRELRNGMALTEVLKIHNRF
jgi:4-hydroxy-4-methyl-2-oxoglutarate aldolase